MSFIACQVAMMCYYWDKFSFDHGMVSAGLKDDHVDTVRWLGVDVTPGVERPFVIFVHPFHWFI